MADKRGKRVRQPLTLDSKVRMIKMCNEGVSQAEVARRLGLTRSTVNTIVKNKEKVLSEIKNATSVNTTVIRKRDSLVADMEKLLIIWIECQTRRHVSVNQAIIQRKAQSLFNDLKAKKGEAGKNAVFGASRGWFDRFKKRSNLHNIRMQREAAIDTEDAKTYPETLAEINEEGGYSKNQIFNVGETGAGIKELNQKICDSQQSNYWMASLNIDVKDEPFELQDEFEPTEVQEEFAYAETISDHTVFREVDQERIFKSSPTYQIETEERISGLDDYENISETAHTFEGKTRFTRRTWNKVSGPNSEDSQKKPKKSLPQKISVTNMDQKESFNLPNLGSSSGKDECSTYGDHIANKLRKLDECSRAVVQHKINNIIFEAEMKKFSKTSEQES